jgi:outer membrane protein TolC
MLLVGGAATAAAPTGQASSEPPSSQSAFDIPTASRLDPYGPRPPGVPSLSRAQITRYALENPVVKAAEQNVVAMEAQLRKARFAWIPEIETMMVLAPGTATQCEDVLLQRHPTDSEAPGEVFDFQYCHPAEDEDLDVQKISGWFKQLGRAGVHFEVRADTVVPIYSFGKWKHTKAMAKQGVIIRELERAQARNETVLRVQEAYMALLLARQTIGILEEGHDVAQKARARVEQDLGDPDDFSSDPAEGNPDRDPDDLFRVELAEIKLEQYMREARKIEALSLSALWALAGKAAPLGFDVEKADLTADEISGGLKALVEYKEIASKNRPKAKMAGALIQLRRAQEKLARAQFLPDLGLLVGAGYGVSNAADQSMNRMYYRDGFNFSRLYAALAMRWDIGFHNRAFDLQKARAELRAAEYQREAALLLLGRDVEQAYMELIDSRHRMALCDRAAKTSWKLVVSQEQRDTVGGGDADDVVRALEKWYEWRFRALEAVQAYNVALASLSRAVGTSLTDAAARRTPKGNRDP